LAGTISFYLGTDKFQRNPGHLLFLDICMMIVTITINVAIIIIIIIITTTTAAATTTTTTIIIKQSTYQLAREMYCCAL